MEVAGRERKDLQRLHHCENLEAKAKDYEERRIDTDIMRKPGGKGEGL
jgi:hypothetical protein